jgi:E3 ubiquitin-protein ligase HUWE1
MVWKQKFRQIIIFNFHRFWRALRSFDKEDKAKFLQFVTGTSKVPLQGFAHLEGMNGTQKFT